MGVPRPKKHKNWFGLHVNPTSHTRVFYISFYNFAKMNF
jgi:hypothetical protein